LKKAYFSEKVLDGMGPFSTFCGLSPLEELRQILGNLFFLNDLGAIFKNCHFSLKKDLIAETLHALSSAPSDETHSVNFVRNLFFINEFIDVFENIHFFRKKDLIEKMQNALSSAPSHSGKRQSEAVL